MREIRYVATIMEFKTLSYLNEKGELQTRGAPKISDEILLKGYRTMVATRHVDERMITLQRQGAIPFALSSKGEEACAVASSAALDFGDWIFPQYREVGVMFWRGCTVEDYLHHMFGNAKDPVLGRQMPNHYGDNNLNVVTVSSPLATQIPHAAGCGYAMKMQKEKNIAITYFGEGTSSKGDFASGLNFAAVRKAPVIFFCRNNGYAISTPTSEQFASDGVAPRGPGHGIETYRVDGNDFFAVYGTVQKAREYCLKGKGPVLIEAMTYRVGAHSTSDDPTRYRDEKEVKKWEKKCPILRLRRYLEKKKLWDTSQEEALEKELHSEITEAIQKAKDTSKPALRTMIEHVYFEVPYALEKQFQERFSHEDHH